MSTANRSLKRPAPRCDALEVASTSNAAKERVRTDFRSGVRSGVNGTPTFFINGQRFDGNWADEEEFIAALKPLLQVARL